jgi:hypothetical protein
MVDKLPLFDHVNALRDEAMQRVGQNAEDKRPYFADAAAAFILRYLDAHGATSGEELTLACKEAGIVPHDDRAFGPVYMVLARRKKIVKVGSVRRSRGHGTAGGNVWARHSRAGGHTNEKHS